MSAKASRRLASARAAKLVMAAASAESGPGAGCHWRDLNGGHAAFRRDIPGRDDDRVTAGGETTGHVLGLAVRHGESVFFLNK
jgi:hypothetical protein